MSALSYRMLQIGGQPAGLLGLEELFSSLYDEGLAPNQPEIRKRLLDGVKQNNFVPKPAAEEYTNALALEYQRYYQRRRTGKRSQRVGGYPAYPGEGLFAHLEYRHFDGHRRKPLPEDSIIRTEGGAQEAMIAGRTFWR